MTDPASDFSLSLMVKCNNMLYSPNETNSQEDQPPRPLSIVSHFGPVYNFELIS